VFTKSALVLPISLIFYLCSTNDPCYFVNSQGFVKRSVESIPAIDLIFCKPSEISNLFPEFMDPPIDKSPVSVRVSTSALKSSRVSTSSCLLLHCIRSRRGLFCLSVVDFELPRSPVHKGSPSMVGRPSIVSAPWYRLFHQRHDRLPSSREGHSRSVACAALHRAPPKGVARCSLHRHFQSRTRIASVLLDLLGMNSKALGATI
jgi:hypothetical protein